MPRKLLRRRLRQSTVRVAPAHLGTRGAATTRTNARTNAPPKESRHYPRHALRPSPTHSSLFVPLVRFRVDTARVPSSDAAHPCPPLPPPLSFVRRAHHRTYNPSSASQAPVDVVAAKRLARRGKGADEAGYRAWTHTRANARAAKLQ